ncbi:unnamed protein product [Rodentolepis nana]|uniref:Coiled-coil domain-containing protein 174 n=1 Tax=Rodentolepis nana TaxID=102285 RepID=A0A0R3TLT6_RODNA|nr:unnamed protein product [Rodentolepis nana]
MQSSTNRRNKRIEVNAVSLIDLKAEISRRQTEVKAKATNILNVSAPVLKRSGGSGISGLLKRPVSPPRKVRKPLDTTEAEKSAEEQTAWDASRRKLEAKARLYDALKQAAISGTGKFDNEEDDKAPLVDFERKAMEASTIDTDSSDDDRDQNRRVRTPPVLNVEPVSIPDGPITYAHLRRGEVRDHGTGFYAFSEDAEQRATEQAALRDLRQRTEQARERVEAERAKRSIAMGRRLAQLRARKGLPDVATAAANLLEESKQSPSPQIADIPPPSSPSQPEPVGEQLGSDDLDIASMLRRLRDEAEAKNEAKNASSSVEVVVQSTRMESTLPRPSYMPKTRITREWDRGKTFVQSSVSYSSQSSSNQQRSRHSAPKRREIANKDDEKDPEFAPPKFY